MACRKAKISLLKITLIVGFIWILGIFIFLQKPNVEEGKESLNVLKELLSNKELRHLNDALKNLDDNEIVDKIIQMASSRNKVKNQILKKSKNDTEAVPNVDGKPLEVKKGVNDDIDKDPAPVLLEGEIESPVQKSKDKEATNTEKLIEQNEKDTGNIEKNNIAELDLADKHDDVNELNVHDDVKKLVQNDDEKKMVQNDDEKKMVQNDDVNKLVQNDDVNKLVQNDDFNKLEVKNDDVKLPVQGVVDETENNDGAQAINVVLALNQPGENKTTYDPNAPGEGGKAVVIDAEKLSPEEKAKYDLGWKNNAFNEYASDQISLHRRLGRLLDEGCYLKKYRSVLPEATVVIIFHNEAMSVLLRTMHSVLDSSPPQYLKQIFLVDDCSDREELKKPLDDYLSKFPNVAVLRITSRVGLIKARLHGFKFVTTEVVIFLDSHCECVEGWLEPLLDRIAENNRTIAIPIADRIKETTFEYEFRKTRDIFLGGFDLDLTFSWRNVPQREKDRRRDSLEPFMTPTFLGCCFAVTTSFFKELGTYDDGFDIWGSEHLELSFKGWMCGGSLEYIPCSHVGHLFRMWSPYKWRKGVDVVRRNNIRLAEVWLDEYKLFFYNRIYYKTVEYGDVSSRKQLRQNLQCKSFGWFVNNIYPELYLPIDSQANGMVKLKGQPLCIESSVQWFNIDKPVYMKTCNTGGIQHWSLTKEGTIRRDESCLGLNDEKILVVKYCTQVGGSVWLYRQDSTIQHSQSGQCLEMMVGGEKLSMKTCDGRDRQMWDWDRKSLTLPLLADG